VPGQAEPGVAGSALLFVLAFGCMLAGNWISQITAPATAHPEATMETEKSEKKLRRLLPSPSAAVVDWF
jgi:hypothetical protein